VLPWHYGVLLPGLWFLKLVARTARSKLNGAKDIVDADPNKRMPQQPESTSPTLTVSAAPLSAWPPTESDRGAPPEFPNPMDTYTQFPSWLRTIVWILRVVIGVFLLLAPWSHGFWDQNPIFQQFPWLGNIALGNIAASVEARSLVSGAARGLVSGLGLLNLWIAFQDALWHRDG